MFTQRDFKKLETFVKFTSEIAELSTCKRAKVGAVIIKVDFTQVLSIGYNGPASGLDNDSCNGLVGNCGCCHAETNALIKLQSPGVLLLTMSPCVLCAAYICNSPVIGVIYQEEYRSLEGVKLLRKADMPILRWERSLAKIQEWWDFTGCFTRT